MVPAYLLVFTTGAIFALCLYPIANYVSRLLGLVDRAEGERKIQGYSVPCSGGILILGSIALSFLTLMLIFPLATEEVRKSISPHILVESRQALSVIAGVISIFLLGAVDDRWRLGPWPKLAFQIGIVLVVLVISDLRMTFFIESEWMNLMVTVLWVVLITNSFNLIDNMDGLCSLVASIVMGLHGILLYLQGSWLLSAVCWLILAPTLVFFMFNRPRARIYLGDSGSLSLGFIVSILCIVCTYYHDGQILVSFLTPLLMMAVPLFDVAAVMALRAKRGLPLLIGDRNHVSHRLLERGLTENQVLVALGGLTLATGISSVFLHRGDEIFGALVILQTCLVLLFFHSMGRRESPK